MKVVIFAGGKGTRISEETVVRPKPMIEIGGNPLLWHIMKIYSAYGLNDFILCLGYKGHMIIEYFSHYRRYHSDITVDVENGTIRYHASHVEPWRITLADTGEETETGGRLKQVARYLKNEKDFCLTYGDGVADINIQQLLAFHKSHGCKATITAVQPPGRFGALQLKGDKVIGFSEKPKGDGGLINGGFFVCSTDVLKDIPGNVAWEKEPLEKLAHEDQMRAYLHKGFWQPVDTLREKNYLEKLWAEGNAPWKIWKD